MSNDPPPRPTNVGREELSTTLFEKFLAVVLAVFLLIGLLWLYAKPLDRTDDQRYNSTYSSPYVQDEYPPAPPVPATRPGATAPPEAGDTGPVGPPRPGDEDLVRALNNTSFALNAARNEVAARTTDDENTREAYRTRLDAKEPADEYKTSFLAVEQALKDAEAKQKDAQTAFDRVNLSGQQAQKRLARAEDELRQKYAHQTFLLRLALTVASLGLSALMLHQLNRRRPRFALLGMSAVAAATTLAVIMTGDYIDIRDVGPIVLAIAGTLVTLAVFIAYQRRLARRLPERRVRKGECPFCGYPSRDGTHCQGCGRATAGACTTCAQARRVGARYCASCGAG